MIIDLSGKVAIIPGSSGGIGIAVAELFVESGADVALSYYSNGAKAQQIAEQARQMGHRGRADRVNATDLSDVKRWVNQILAEYGQIDILMDCVGWGAKSEMALFKDVPPEKWKTILDLEFMHCLYFTHAVINHMISRKSGRIISIGSDSAKAGDSGLAVSAAGRGANTAFFKSIAREVARYGITVNTVCPGPVDTPCVDEFKKAEFGEKIIAAMIRSVPMKRLATPREIANAAVFLASDAASFITGQAISVSGGLTMY